MTAQTITASAKGTRSEELVSGAKLQLIGITVFSCRVSPELNNLTQESPGVQGTGVPGGVQSTNGPLNISAVKHTSHVVTSAEGHLADHAPRVHVFSDLHMELALQGGVHKAILGWEVKAGISHQANKF